MATKQKVTIEMKLPDGEKVEASADFMQWLLANKLMMKSQGIECRIFVDDEEMKFVEVADLDQNFREKRQPS